jgi:hypothetical protein
VNNTKPLIAMALKTRQAIPRWYSLAPLHSSFGLKLTVHFETWLKTLAPCEGEINPWDFEATVRKDGWVNVTFPFPSGDASAIRSLQKTIAILFDSMDCVEKDVHLHRPQLVACGALRSVNELKGYLLDAYISYEMKCFLAKANVSEVDKLMTNAMKKAARHLGFSSLQKYCVAAVQDGGFLYFGIGDGSGTLLAADFRDRERLDTPTGYAMTSDNIDHPAIQLIFLYVLATISAWGEKQ